MTAGSSLDSATVGIRKSSVDRIRRFATTWFFGRARYQPAFELLLDLSLRGMNHGGGQDVGRSGQDVVFRYVAEHATHGPSTIVVDVGAHNGDFACAAAAAFGDGSTVWAMEPSATVFAELERNVRAVPRIQPVNIGLSDSCRSDALVAPVFGSKLGSLHGATLAAEHGDPSVEEPVELATLDNFCESHAIGRIQLLKIDVEGHELAVLSGATEMLAAERIDFIQFEFGPWNVRSRTYLRDFFVVVGRRFRICRILRDGLRELPRYDERHEIFAHATNYLAVRRSLASAGLEAAGGR